MVTQQIRRRVNIKTQVCPASELVLFPLYYAARWRWLKNSRHCPQKCLRLLITGPISPPQSSTGCLKPSWDQELCQLFSPLMAGNKPENIHSVPPAPITFHLLPGMRIVRPAVWVVIVTQTKKMKKTTLFLTTFIPPLFELWIL